MIPLYLDLVRRTNWPSPAPYLHPIINMIPGAIDPLYAAWDEPEKIPYGLEQGLLRAIGAVVIVGISVNIIERRVERLRGGIPIEDDTAIVYLDIQGLPVASIYAQTVLAIFGKRPKNLIYAVLYHETQPRPDRCPHSLFRAWYGKAVNFNMDATDTSVLKSTGALDAPCVIIACDNRSILNVNALSIWNWRKERNQPFSQIIPVSRACFGTSEPFVYTDFDTRERHEIADAPICPLGFLRETLTG
jgi:hypothetical protein